MSNRKYLTLFWGSAIVLGFIAGMLLAVAFPKTSKGAIYIGPPPITPYYGSVYVGQPQQPIQGQYVMYNRPCWLGQALFGPIMVWTPMAQQQPQQQSQGIQQLPAPIR